jgi:hypothetical protein
MAVLDDFLNEEETAAELRKTVRTLRAWRRDGIGPPYCMFGRTAMYHKDALRRHYLDQQVTPARMRQPRRAKATSSARA